jgi:DNA-binding NtrC family response regulator
MMAPAHLLIVDDEPDVLDVLEATLQQAGFRTSSFGNGDAAARVDPMAIDMLITDIRMPGPLNGLHLADALRSNRADLPILFLSGDLNGLANSGDLPPPTAFLVKPIDPGALVQSVGRLLSPKH